MIHTGFPFPPRIFWWLLGAKALALLVLLVLSASRKGIPVEEKIEKSAGTNQMVKGSAG